MVGKMINEGMLAELDMDNIPNIAGVGETYLDRSFDPGNKYSVPYMWGTTGLIYNTTMVEEPPTKWADMWDVEYTNNVLMFNNSRDAFAIAAKVAGPVDEPAVCGRDYRHHRKAERAEEHRAGLRHGRSLRQDGGRRSRAWPRTTQAMPSR